MNMEEKLVDLSCVKTKGRMQCFDKDERMSVEQKCLLDKINMLNISLLCYHC